MVTANGNDSIITYHWPPALWAKIQNSKLFARTLGICLKSGPIKRGITHIHQAFKGFLDAGASRLGSGKSWRGESGRSEH